MSRQDASCAWCGTTEPPLIPVGCIEQGTSAGALVHACRTCCDSRGIVPFADHPADTDGQPRYYRTPPLGRSGT